MHIGGSAATILEGDLGAMNSLQNERPSLEPFVRERHRLRRLSREINFAGDLFIIASLLSTSSSPSRLGFRNYGP